LKSGLRFDYNYEREKIWVEIQLATKENQSPNHGTMIGRKFY
jgi:hypothetical protein